MRLLFAKTSLGWPRVSGHDGHTYNTMKACAALGHEVWLALASEASPEALEGLRLAGLFRLDTSGPHSRTMPSGTWLQRRFRSFWGVDENRIASLLGAVQDVRPDAVIVVGLDALPYFPSLAGVQRVWFAADEWVLHHLSQVRWTDKSSWSHVRSAAIKGLYERAHTRVVDRTWVVSHNERRAMRWFAGMRNVDVVSLGVDSEYFQPTGARPEANSAVFWGRLDFGPNIQALQWFCTKVWPGIVRRSPQARFTIVGFNPGPDVMSLTAAPGVSLIQDLPDLRDTVARHDLAVLPFVSGGGVKNKLLEAAALGLPIVCTPLAAQGLKRMAEASFEVTGDPAAMRDAILNIWSDRVRRNAMGASAREWVVKHHSWTATAREAMASLAAGAGKGTADEPLARLG